MTLQQSTQQRGVGFQPAGNRHDPSGDLAPSSAGRLAEAIDEFYAALDAGQPPNRAALLEKYADVATELSACLASLDFIQTTAPQLRGTDHTSCQLPITNSQQPNQSELCTPKSAFATLGDFQILREIGRGGMGIVYEAQQLSLGRRMALKVLPFAATLDRTRLKRFQNEARAAATLDHPNIVAVHSVGEERGVHYYAMQLVEGQSLAEVIAALRKEIRSQRSEVRTEWTGDREQETGRTEQESGHQPTAYSQQPRHSALDTLSLAAIATERSTNPSAYFRRVAEIGAQVATALDYAHQSGVIHRDIKPGNIMLDPAGKALITDFGLARIEADQSVTTTGNLLGTLRYMTPEQATGKGVVDHHTDIYSLGATLYEALALMPALAGSDRGELLRKIAEETPSPLTQLNARIPKDLATIVGKAMEKDPADRYESAGQFAADLRAFAEHRPITARPPSVAARAHKWVRRHPTLTASSLAALFVLLVASGVALALLGSEQARTNTVLDDKTAALDRSQRSLAVAVDAIDQMIVRFAGDAEAHGDLHHAEMFFQDAATHYDRLLEHSSEVDVRRRASRAYGFIGRNQDQLGLYEDAKRTYERAVQVRSALVAEFPNSMADESDLADAYDGLGNALWSLGNLAGAEQSFKHSLAISERHAAAKPNDAEEQFALAVAHGGLASVYVEMGRLDEAERLHRLAVAALDRLPGEFLRRPLIMSTHGTATANLAIVLRNRGDLPAARDLLERALWMHVLAAQLAPESPLIQQNHYHTQRNRADIQLRLGKHAIAADVVESIIEGFPELLVAYLEAIELLEQAAEIAEAEDGAPPSPEPPPASAYRARAGALVRQSRAARQYTPDVARQMSWLLLSHPQKEFRDVPRALTLAQRAVEQVPTSGDFHWTLAAARYYAGEYDAAEAALAKAHESREQGAWSWLLLAMIEAHRGNEQAARDLLHRAEVRISQRPPDESLRRFYAEAAETVQHFLTTPPAPDTK